MEGSQVFREGKKNRNQPIIVLHNSEIIHSSSGGLVHSDVPVRCFVDLASPRGDAAGSRERN